MTSLGTFAAAAVVLLLVQAHHTLATVNSDNCRHLSGVDVYDRSFILTEDSLRTAAFQYAVETSLSRAIFFSLMYKWTAIEFWSADAMNKLSTQPGVNYIYMSSSANIHAAPAGVVTSGLFFDTNSSYPNWIRDVSFNTTLPLFGVRANRTVVKDLGSTLDSNYTNSAVYPQNMFYWHLRTSNAESLPFPFILHHATGAPDMPTEEVELKVNTYHGDLTSVTPPFFDCGQTNTWMLNAVSMVTEMMVRSSMWTHLRSLKSVAASTVGVDVEALKTADFQLPSWSRVEEAEQQLSQHDASQCSDLEVPVPLPAAFWSTERLALVLEPQGRAALRMSHFLSNFLQNNDPAQTQINEEYIQARWMARMYAGDRNMEMYNDPMVEVIWDHNITRKQLVSEVFAIVMASDKVLGVGIFLDTGVFPDSATPTSMFAWKSGQDGRGRFGSVTDVYVEGEDFTAQDWFLTAQQEYSTLTAENSQSFSTARELRTGRNGPPKPEPQPFTYTATAYSQGRWLPPQFVCGPRVKGWVASYVSPVFTRGAGDTAVFGGVVKIDIKFTGRDVTP